MQVEHSITEATTGVDLVKAQIFVADGGRLTDLYGAKPGESGHAVEARLNAEDPDRDFAPAPGRIVRLELPAGPGVRVDTGVAEGDTIPPDFDSMIAKIIAVGRTREEALARLRRAMRETTVVIEGGACNKSFVLDLLAQPEVVDGTGGWADTGWIDRVRAEGRLVAHAHAGVAIVASAIEAYTDEVELEVTRLLETAHGGRPQAQHKPGRAVEVKLRGTAYQVSTLNTGPSRYQVTVDGRRPHHDRGGRARPPRRVPPAARGRRSTAPRGHLHLRPDHPGRGRRHRPPRHPGRGWRAAFAGPGSRRGHTRRASATRWRRAPRSSCSSR